MIKNVYNPPMSYSVSSSYHRSQSSTRHIRSLHCAAATRLRRKRNATNVCTYLVYRWKWSGRDHLNRCWFVCIHPYSGAGPPTLMPRNQPFIVHGGIIRQSNVAWWQHLHDTDTHSLSPCPRSPVQCE